MKYTFSFIILTLCLISANAQTNSRGGVFKFWSSSDEEFTGILYIYPVSETTSIFYLEINLGAPSYNSGSLLGEIILNGEETGDYKFISEEEDIQCALKFTLSKDFVNIQSDISNCGFGHGVNADGLYKRINRSSPIFFIDREGKKIYFEDLKF